jgi:uncharacterized membrane protein
MDETVAFLATLLVALGICITAVGLVMPAETTETEDVTVGSETGEIERQTDNEMKQPLMVGGLVVAVVGVGVWVAGDDGYEEITYDDLKNEKY